MQAPAKFRYSLFDKLYRTEPRMTHAPADEDPTLGAETDGLETRADDLSRDR